MNIYKKLQNMLFEYVNLDLGILWLACFTIFLQIIDQTINQLIENNLPIYQ